MKAKTYASLTIVVLVLVALCDIGHATQPIAIRVLHTNDMHGSLIGDGEHVGTLPALYDIIRRTRSEDDSHHGTILLDAGDLLEGTALDHLTRGRMMIDALGILGYDAWTLGNHDFWVGRSDLADLVAEVRRHDVAVLGANIIDSPSGRIAEDLAVPYTLIERNGITIAIIGLAHGATGEMNHADRTLDLEFANPLDSLEYWTRRVRDADITIILCHLGLGARGSISARDVQRIPGSVKVIIDSHSHRVTHEPRHLDLDDGSRAIIVQAGSNLGWIGKLTLYFDPRSGSPMFDGPMVRHDYEMIDLREHTRTIGLWGADPTAAEPADRESIRSGDALPHSVATRTWKLFAAPHVEQLHRTAGTAGVTFERHTPGTPDPWGNLIADGLTRSAQTLYAQGLLDELFPTMTSEEFSRRLVAIETTRSVRGTYDEGSPIRYGSLYSNLPFDNLVTVVHVTGKEIRRLIEFTSWHRRRGGVLTSGITGRINPRARAGERIVDLFVHGVPLDDDEEYALVTTDFIAGGNAGWGHGRLNGRPRFISSISTRQSIWYHLTNQSNPEALGRDVNEVRLETIER